MPGNKIALRSLLNEDVPKDVRDDLRALAGAIVTPAREYAGRSVFVGTEGTFDVKVIPSTSTSGSDGSNYHTVSVTRNGEVGISKRGTQATLPTTNNVELVAFQEYNMGEMQVGNNAFIAVKVTVTGAPSPTLTDSDFVVKLTEIDRRGE